MAALNYQTWGERCRSAVLLVHPLGADLRFWSEIAPQLARRFFSIACDLRSAGRSPVADRPLGLDEHVADLEELRRSLGVETVIPVGVAVGAMIATAYAARSAARIAGLVLSSPGVRFAESAQRMLAERIAFGQANGMGALVDPILARAFAGQPHDARRRAFATMVAGQPMQGYADLAAGISTADLSGDLPRIACPTLVLTSTGDLLMPPAMAEAVTAAIAGARLVHVDAAAHFIPYQAPEAFLDCVLPFLHDAMDNNRMTAASAAGSTTT